MFQHPHVVNFMEELNKNFISNVVHDLNVLIKKLEALQNIGIRGFEIFNIISHSQRNDENRNK